MLYIQGESVKKLFILGVVLMPVAGFALDTSDCETIGYWQSADTTCEMYDDCVKSIQELGADKNPEVACADAPRTAEECTAKIAAANEASAETDSLIKCPVTDARLAQKNAYKTAQDGGKFMATGVGTEIDVDDLIADNDNVYYVKLSHGLAAIIARGADAWYVIGPRDKDGLYLARPE